MSKPVSVGDALQWARDHGLDRLDSQLLTLHALQRSPHDRAWLLAHDQETVSALEMESLAVLVHRRQTGEPLAYITGRKEFAGLDLTVSPHVLIPRPDTETLVDWALETVSRHMGPVTQTLRLLDLGTGSGAIALAIKFQRPDLHVVALDASPLALTIARANAQRLALNIDFVQGDWLARIEGPFYLIVSNPPYVASEDPHLKELRHEPDMALVSGPDGLDALRRIVGQSPARLEHGGWLLLEHGHDQAAAVRELLQRSGFANIQSRNDLAGIARCSGGQWLSVK